MAKVLVIDDTEDVRELITDMLSFNGFEVHTTPDGPAGLSAARKICPDLVLCDIQMPGWDGFETLEKIRAIPEMSGVPFIFLTGMGEKPLIRRGMELGADDFLTKPFTMPELLGAVRTQLDKKAAIALQTEQKLEVLRGNISMALPHELLTPIAGILGFSSIIFEDHASMPASEIEDAAKSIQEAALRLRRTIENFLLYTQIELVSADPAKTAATRVACNEHHPENLTRAGTQIAAEYHRGGDLRFEAVPVTMSMSPDQLEKVITELLANAFKFSETGTEVRFSARPNGSHYTITVEDHGRGFTRDQIQSIGAHMQFERRFYEQQGTGLGLSIVKRLAELHGGNLAIESTPGQFSKLSVHLPMMAA